MRILFMGSSEFACPSLDRLAGSCQDTVPGIITQPDRPKGRSRKTGPCPVRAHVENARIPVLTPRDVNDHESLRNLNELSPDLIIVVAYGQILKPRVLQIPRLGCVNVHASLLPKYRGAAPIEWAIARGETMTGITTIHMNSEMDAGDIIIQAQEPIKPDDTAGTSSERLARLGADVLEQTLNMIRNGTACRRPQAHSQATYAPKLKKSDGKLDWTRPATDINNRVRGFNPRPGCFFEHASGGKVRVFKTRVESFNSAGKEIEKVPAGSVLATEGKGPLVLTGSHAIRLLEVQPEGRKMMSGSSYLSGHSMKTGELLR